MAEQPSRWSVLVVWTDGEEEYVRSGLCGGPVVVFTARHRAEGQLDFMLQGMAAEV